MPLPPREYDRTLNAEIERLLYQVESVKLEGEGVMFGLDEEAFNWRPSPARWSVAQCLEHLNITNGIFLGNLEKAIEQGRARGKYHDGPYSYGWLSRWMFQKISPGSGGKVKAPGRFQPPERLRPDDVLAKWQAQHERVLELLRRANGLDLAGIKVVSPITSLLRYDLGMGFWILTAHDRRHLAQAKEVIATVGFPARVSVPTQSRTD